MFGRVRSVENSLHTVDTLAAAPAPAGASVNLAWSPWPPRAGRRRPLFEQTANVVGGEVGGEEVAVVHDAAEEVCLAAGECHDLLLDGVARDQPVDIHRPGLADAVGAVDRLVLGGGVPPGVEQEAVVGLGEVEAEAAGLEADQEHRVGAALEAVEHAIALARAA